MNPHNFPVTQREPEARMHNFQRRGRYRASRCYDGLLDIEDEDPYAREEALDSFGKQHLFSDRTLD